MKYFIYLSIKIRNKFLCYFAIVLSAGIVTACNNDNKETTQSDTTAQAPPPVVSPVNLNYEVVNTFPHDTSAFTEGFLLHQGQLYESTGSPTEMSQTRSLIGTVDLKTGKIDKKIELDRSKYFGEGMVILNDKIYQLTYTTKVGFVYDAKTFKKLQEFTFPNQEGWGLTTDGTHLIMSDGTSQLTYLDPTTFKTIKTLQVKFNYDPLVNLNELEYIKGVIYANIYTTNSIVRIDEATGQATGILDLTALTNQVKSKYPPALELNGIAFNPTAGTIYVTGKLWPSIFELKIKA
ncbi:glutaminyl-peptide cyclotransferase [Adhaeribacter pallidiroseus]|uniref:Glutaminyl-peptide cyclotransferase n=1 Tax=Adhaeribacter pallidiroseus TaxID=2072847 RepID=A0A369QJ16_9BACT|nr:glutaminyl-peptide cyclotransferase [Adhaeribacter pallidiroseus]RDC64923.1 Glutaminyl-peptide cyclotransferase [Adhaeribacter pallidiroseus]